MPIELFEGPDLAGKTTLINQRAAKLVREHKNVTILKRGPIREDVMTEYLRPFDVLIQDPSAHLLLDRWHVGELIYGPLLRGQSQLTERQAAYIEMVMQSLDCAFNHITAPIPTLEDRYDMRGDSLIKREWLGEIQEQYFAYVHDQMGDHWRTQVADIFTPIYPKLSTLLPGWYIGHLRPKVLLLGDERASDDFTWPFVPRRATSGHWLMGALAQGKVNHMDVGIINSGEHTLVQLHSVWEKIGSPPVIALGRNAEAVWKSMQICFSDVPNSIYLHHPQYQRRFHYMSFGEYGRKIKEVMENG